MLTQLQQYQTQLNQYANMVQNTIALPQSAWSSVSSDIMQVRNLANAGSMLTGSNGSIMTRLNSIQGYASSATLTSNQLSQQMVMWQQNIANAQRSLGSTLGLQQNQQMNYTALQTAIDQHSQTAAGQMQAIQAGNELASLTNTQLQQIQTTLLAQAQYEATKGQTAADREATLDANDQRFLTYTPMPTTGNQAF
jgi:P-type conjugative transfer protein TrbJ